MPADRPGPDGGPADRGPQPEPLHELTLGRRASSPAKAKPPHDLTTRAEPADADLDEIAARCRLKAEAARWAAEGQRRLREGAEAASPERDVIAWADTFTDGYYWMQSPDTAQPADLSLLDNVGGCFETLADALSLMRDGEGQRGAFERAVPLLAEAQSAVRASLHALHAPDDPDQVQVFEWLKATAARHHVYIKRFMRADDPADPAGWPDLLARIEGVDAKSRPSRGRSPRIDRVRCHQEAIREGKGTDQDWRAVIEAVEAMVGEGVPPSSREIRELLLPVVDDLPDRDDLPPGFRLVLREIDRFLATRPPPSGAAATPRPTADVEEVRRLLGGRGVVLIGGNCRRESQKLLKAALGLKDLTWIETKEHQSIRAFGPAIARPDVALVLLAIRWSSHAFGEVKPFCDRYAKPLVRLPGGYSPNQVAAQIRSQCSAQLGGG